jgi:AraC family transcriptional activator of pobA
LKKRLHKIHEFDLSPLAKAGLAIKNLRGPANELEHENNKPHRDNHYILVFTTQGQFKLNLDFQEITFYAPTLLLIAPEQVHHMIETINLQGWAISFDTSLMNHELQAILDKSSGRAIPVDEQNPFYQEVYVLMQLIEKMQSENPNAYTGRSTQSLLNAILHLVAGQIVTRGAVNKTKESRRVIIEQAFLQLLKLHYKNWKQPAQYAAELNISVTHLYDTVKDITGSSVSEQIQRYSILEAKRLLYFTDLSVKEIGFELGYYEPVYFGKLFKKITGLTPLQFRQQYRD